MEAGGGERSSFRCLHAARYVLAAVMTALVATIAFNFVKLVLYERFHEPVRLSVVRGTVVFARRPPAALVFYHGVRVSSARGFRYYAANATACLSSSSGGGAIACFRPNGTITAVEQRGQSYFLMEAEGTRDAMNSSYFDALYDKGGSPRGRGYVTLRLESAFVAERRSGWNTTTSWNVYDCDLLTIKALDDDDEDELHLLDDNFCQPRN